MTFLVRYIPLAAALAWAGCSSKGGGEPSPGDLDGGGSGGDGGDVEAGGDGESDVAGDSGVAEGGGEGDGDAEGDGCPAGRHLDGGECVPDVCQKGKSTCASPTERKVCHPDGAGFDVEACPAGDVCELGVCVAPVCEPDGPPGCDGSKQKVCNSLGTGWNALPCPGGHACHEGVCQPLQPNVVLLVDTSGSMSWVAGTEDLPETCEGPGCVPWTFPDCDDPAAPVTKLGRAKKALQKIVQSEAAKPLRLALQRFPQVGLGPFEGGPTCVSGTYGAANKILGDDGDHVTSFAWFESGLWQVVSVPFAADGSTDTDEILRWTDFVESVEPTGKGCTVSFECEKGVCLDKECHVQSEPELRGVGDTPIGRSLFYAGEYLRHFVLVEGRHCATDASCGSPHHTCVGGRCHDPHHACRPNAILVLTDGRETADEDPGSFFHPRVQAKRLHYGLGCHDDGDCLHGATCSGAGVCVPPFEVPPGVCHAFDMACTGDAECPSYACGPSRTCSGLCEPTGADFDDPDGADLLRDPDGNPIAVTVHVIDAAPEDESDSMIALFGGGQHVPVDFEDIESVVSGFLPLLDVKSAPACD